ncbi:MAG TPA: sensor domain-containing diguanylate cyclase [Acidimicrobiia bacterium]
MLAATLVGVVLAGLATIEYAAQQDTKSVLVERFGVRGTTAVGFVESYTSYLLTRERTLAQQQLVSRHVTDAQFSNYLNVFGFGPSVLLDASGRVMVLEPYQANLIGADLAAQYTHLARAAAGHPMVSNVVPAIGQNVPVVAFATPFQTPYGRRVVSGAFDISSRPLGLYLRHVLPYANGGVFLVDNTGLVIASNRSHTTHVATPPSRVVTQSSNGVFDDAQGDKVVYATIAVPETPWRLVLTVPASTLYTPISARSRFLPWLLFVGFSLASGGLVFEFVRYREGRAAARVDARTDLLTGLPNRRAVEEALERLLADHNRYGTTFGVLVVDVDRFKRVNDEHGHAAGDVVLCQIAARAAGCVRLNDLVGRWGGEEFVVLAPHTDRDGLVVLGERIRDAMRNEVMTVDGTELPVTVSAGGAVARLEDGASSLVGRADAALYTAKSTGRDRTIVAEDMPITSLSDAPMTL